MAREIDALQPDLLMTHGFNGHIVALVTRLLRKYPVVPVCSYHGEYYPTNDLRGVLIRMYNRAAEYYIRRHALGVVSVAEFSKRYLVTRGVDAGKVRVIHNGLDNLESRFEARSRLRNEWNVHPCDCLIGVASRLDPVKGVSYLVDAFAVLAPRFPKLKLVIIGTGACENEIKNQVRERRLVERTVFTGFRSDVDDCLAAFDIFALPSLAECHSIALLEAMRAKKAVIATDVGGNPESVRHEKEALLVPPADVCALAGAIERFVIDDALRSKLSEAAHERFLEKFTIEHMVSQTAEWLLQCGTTVR